MDLFIETQNRALPGGSCPIYLHFQTGADTTRSTRPIRGEKSSIFHNLPAAKQNEQNRIASHSAVRTRFKTVRLWQ
jgi:hypothetical protein